MLADVVILAAVTEESGNCVVLSSVVTDGGVDWVILSLVVGIEVVVPPTVDRSCVVAS